MEAENIKLDFNKTLKAVVPEISSYELATFWESYKAGT